MRDGDRQRRGGSKGQLDRPPAGSPQLVSGFPRVPTCRAGAPAQVQRRCPPPARLPPVVAPAPLRPPRIRAERGPCAAPAAARPDRLRTRARASPRARRDRGGEGRGGGERRGRRGGEGGGGEGGGGGRRGGGGEEGGGTGRGSARAGTQQGLARRGLKNAQGPPPAAFSSRTDPRPLRTRVRGTVVIRSGFRSPSQTCRREHAGRLSRTICVCPVRPPPSELGLLGGLFPGGYW